MIKIFNANNDRINNLLDWLQHNTLYGDIIEEVKFENSRDTIIFFDKFNGYSILFSSLGSSIVNTYKTVPEAIAGIINKAYHNKHGHGIDNLDALKIRVKEAYIELNLESILIWYVFYLYNSTKYIEAFDKEKVNLRTYMTHNNLIQELGITIDDNTNRFDIKFFVGKQCDEFLQDTLEMAFDKPINDTSLLRKIYYDVLDSIIDHIKGRLTNDKFNSNLFIKDGDYRLIIHENLKENYVMKNALNHAITTI